VTTSIFIKSYPPDFGWLAYCLKSIHRFSSGFHEIVVVIPEGSNLSLTQERVIKIPEPQTGNGMHGIGYVTQQLAKMSADKYCTGDNICFLDSDCILVKPVTPNDLMVESVESDGEETCKPLWLMTPMIEVTSGDKNAHAHATSMREFSGEDSEFEFMRRHSQVVPKWALGCFRDYVQERHQMSFSQWAVAQPFRGVTEFNFLGQFLYREYRNFIHFHDTRFGIPESFVKQYWSWSGLTPEIRSEIEAILS
jgi:hypothetical protein